MSIKNEGFFICISYFFISDESDYTNQDLIDRTVWAELPDENLDPDGVLSELVKTHMIHGPCGHIGPECLCMNDKNDGRGKKCKAGYPKQFQEETSGPENEYPLNRRQNGQGPRYQWMKKVCSTDICIDNQWVVSYSPFLL